MTDLIVIHDNDGAIHADRLIRCENCANGELEINFYGEPCIHCYNSANGVSNVLHRLNWFCADGELKES